MLPSPWKNSSENEPGKWTEWLEKKRPDPLWQMGRRLDFQNQQRPHQKDLPGTSHGAEHQPEFGPE